MEERKDELCDFIGTIIGGIYEGIKNDAFNGQSDFEEAAGRPYKSIYEMIDDFKMK